MNIDNDFTKDFLFFQELKDAPKVRLSGYGVELAIKSTEYKNVDDQKVADTKKKEKLTELGDDEVEGFLFNRLRYLKINLNCVSAPIIIDRTTSS